MIDPHLEGLSVSYQCELLSIPRSTYYYERQEVYSDENLALLRPSTASGQPIPPLGRQRSPRCCFAKAALQRIASRFGG